MFHRDNENHNLRPASSDESQYNRIVSWKHLSWMAPRKNPKIDIEYLSSYQKNQILNPRQRHYHQSSKPANFKSANAATNLTYLDLT